MNVLQKSEVWLRSELLEHIATIYGLPKQAREAVAARKTKDYPLAIQKITGIERVLSDKKNAEVDKKIRVKAWDYHKAQEKAQAKAKHAQKLKTKTIKKPKHAKPKHAKNAAKPKKKSVKPAKTKRASKNKKKNKR